MGINDIYTNSDAPALSSVTDFDAVSGVGATLAVTTLNEAHRKNEQSDAPTGFTGAGEDQWDEEAMAATVSKKSTTAALTEKLLDMKAMQSSSVDDDIAEKMRIEEIKAQLKAAKEGMEREAQRMKEKQDRKEDDCTFKTAGASSGRFSAVASGLGGEGGKYVPRHLRSGVGGMGGTRAGWGSSVPSSFSQKVDTKDAKLFPDLATADNIIEEQKKQEQKKTQPKKTPLRGSTWGACRAEVRASATQSGPKEKARETLEGPKFVIVEKVEVRKGAIASKSVTGSTAAAGGGRKKKTKKKDLSTFKPSS